ncbi:MAG: DUF4595 domain-containing protein [Bacteroidaceae bacterium]|nr:DUF4595 domain-containing protein [Bacteroidaceae bacterium]
MKKTFLTFLMTGMVVCAVSTSCSKDDDGDGGGGASAQSGTLAGDDAEANAAVEGVRVSAVGSYRYSYDENGKLESISSNNYQGWVLEAKNNFKMQWEDEHDTEELSFSISNNHITGASIKYTDYGLSEGTITGSGSASFSYNSKGQLTSISASSSESGNLFGEKYSASAKTTTKYTYSSDNRLLSIKFESNFADEGENGKETALITFDYSTSYPNLFYQFTPEQCPDIVFDMGGDAADFDVFAYVGLLGKASSYLPSGYTEEYLYEEDGEEDESGTYNRSCNYSFNSNGTISRAGNKSYSYTNVDTRAVVIKEGTEQEVKNNVAQKSFGRLLNRIHEHRAARRAMQK